MAFSEQPTQCEALQCECARSGRSKQSYEFFIRYTKTSLTVIEPRRKRYVLSHFCLLLYNGIARNCEGDNFSLLTRNLVLHTGQQALRPICSAGTSNNSEQPGQRMVSSDTFRSTSILGGVIPGFSCQ